MLLENYLQKKYDVTTLENGEDGLHWLQDGNLPDLIVADIQMPKVDGYEFIKNVRASGYFKDIPMIMLSARESSTDKVKALKMGANDYMVKPFNPEELEVRIELLLARS
jgi:DNA-binding response OmpR family regulator